MSKSKKTIATTEVKKEIAPSVEKVNLSKYAERLQKVEVKEIKKKQTLYNYPDGFSESDINNEKGKKFRNSLRTAMKRFANNITLAAKQNDAEKLQKEIAEFKIFYKKNYRVNDFSLSSITNTKDEGKEYLLSLAIDIVKELNK